MKPGAGWLLAVAALLAGTAWGAAEPGAGTGTAYAAEVRALEQAQARIGDLSADFTLTVRGGAAQGRALNARGKIFLSAGRRYRVEYTTPEVQWLISDGKVRWLYLKKINQVQKQALPPAGNPSEFFLELGGGLADLLKRSRVTRVLKDAGAPGRWEYDSVPLSAEGFGYRRARIWVEGEALLPVRVEIDAEKPVSVALSHVIVHTRAALNRGEPGLPARLFEFTPPADADVVEPLFP
jgi:outer membrane lipoprotein-sorting protein